MLTIPDFPDLDDTNFSPANADSLESGDLPVADIELNDPTDDALAGFTVPDWVGLDLPVAEVDLPRAVLPAWLTALAIEEAPAIADKTLSIESSVVPLTVNWDLDLAAEPDQPMPMSTDDWRFLRGSYNSQPAENKPTVLEALIVGQTREIDGESRHEVSVLELYEDRAQQKMLAEFHDLELATRYFYDLHDNSRDLPAGQLADFGEFASSTHAEWQSVELVQAHELAATMRVLTQDVTPPPGLEVSAVIDTTPAVRYEPLILPSVQDGEPIYEVLMTQFIADGRSSDMEQANYASLGVYPTSQEADAVITGLEGVRQQIADVVGHDDLRADHMLVSTARAIAVGNGLVAADAHLFPDGSDVRFDDAVAPELILHQIETALNRDEVVVTAVEQEIQAVASLNIEM